MRFTNYDIVMRELPNEVALAINISGCPFSCEGCHSPELQEDVGTELTPDEIEKLVESYIDGYITAICFMGGEQHPEFYHLIKWLSEKYPILKIGLYTGADDVENKIKNYLHYVKCGEYIQG